MRRAQYLVAALAVAVAACGGGGDGDDGDDGDDGNPIDAPPTIDAADPIVDGPMADAGPPPPDAAVSSVIVVAGPCAGGADHTLTNAGLTFVFDGTGGTPPIAIDVGETIQYTSSLNHNFTNGMGPAPPHGFRSGPINMVHTACLTFTQAFTGTYVCELHSLAMSNSLTVQ